MYRVLKGYIQICKIPLNESCVSHHICMKSEIVIYKIKYLTLSLIYSVVKYSSLEFQAPTGPLFDPCWGPSVRPPSPVCVFVPPGDIHTD